MPMSQVSEVLNHIRAFGIPPLGAVVFAALLAALLEQRLVRKRTPHFNARHRGVAQTPPPTDPGARRR
jgi:hypothetical protein